MTYKLWNDDDKKWFKDEYDNINDARKSACKRRCYYAHVCVKKGKEYVSIGYVMHRDHNKYGVPIYFSYSGDGCFHTINPDGSLGKKLD